MIRGQQSFENAMIVCLSIKGIVTIVRDGQNKDSLYTEQGKAKALSDSYQIFLARLRLSIK